MEGNIQSEQKAKKSCGFLLIAAKHSGILGRQKMKLVWLMNPVIYGVALSTSSFRPILT